MNGETSSILSLLKISTGQGKQDTIKSLLLTKQLKQSQIISNAILLTLATGTGKTFIAFQIAWKLFQARWNLQLDGRRAPRILFLADRNILANQAYLDFGQFGEDALVRINPSEISKKAKCLRTAVSSLRSFKHS
jgi:type I site-specific restriction endonuclease